MTAGAATVGVSYFDLSPNPVYIKAGEIVYWDEADPDFGPYLISGAWGSFWTPDGIQFNSSGTYQYSAQSMFGGGSWNGSVVVSPNSLPHVTITTPTNGTVFQAPATVVIEANAADPDPDDVWDVEFWVGTEMVDDVYSPPYTTTVTNLPSGTYTLKAIVWDHSYAKATNSVTIIVLNPGPITLGTIVLNSGKLEFKATGLVAGRTNVLQASTNLAAQVWINVSTNISTSTDGAFTNVVSGDRRFFRIMQLP
jgi:hypothetical protein